MRVFIGPVEIASFYSSLYEGFKKLNIPSDLVFNFAFKNGQKLEVSASGFQLFLVNNISRFRFAGSKYFVKKVFLRLVFWFYSYFYLLYCLKKYDFFVFGFGESLLPDNHDLPFLKFFKKKTIMIIGHGSEIRPPFLDGSYFDFENQLDPELSFYLDRTKKIIEKVNRIEKLCTHVISSMGISHYLTRKVIELHYVGLPFHPGEIVFQVPRRSQPGRLRILHAPSHKGVKGTIVIRAVIQKLLKIGYDFDFIEVSGKPHKEVLAELQSCDFVIDQIYGDSPSSSFTVEAGWFRKPSIIGGYRIKDVVGSMVSDCVFPSHVIYPDELESAIVFLIDNPKYRIDLGNKAFDFLQNNWIPELVATKILAIFDNKFDTRFYFEPRDFSFVDGIGQEKAKTISVCKKFISKYGFDSLGFQKRPDLVKAIKDLVFQAGDCQEEAASHFH